MIELGQDQDGRVTIEADFEDKNLIFAGLENSKPDIASRLSHNIVHVGDAKFILDADAAGIYLISLNVQADIFLRTLFEEVRSK